MHDKKKCGVFTNYRNVSCQIYTFYEHVCYLMSSWLIVRMAAERVVAMCLPFRKTVLRTQTGAIVMIISTFVLMCISQIFRFIMIKNVGGNCEGDMDTHSEYLNFYQFTLYLTLPFILVLVCNSMVIYQIHRVRKTAGNTRSRVVERSHKTTLMLFAILFTYPDSPESCRLTLICHLLCIHLRISNYILWDKDNVCHAFSMYSEFNSIIEMPDCFHCCWNLSILFCVTK